MEPHQLMSQIRKHYLVQLQEFVVAQQKALGMGAGEVKFHMGENSRYYKDLICIDFAAGGEKPQYLELPLERTLSFDPISLTVAGTLILAIDSIRWDDVRIEHDVAEVDEEGLGRWFHYWFDPDDERHIDGADIGNIIHRVTIEPFIFEVDFGSARPDAFWALIDVLRASGATRVRAFSADIA